VNVTVSDHRGGFDNHNFTLEVINVNDAPIWIQVPEDLEIVEGEALIYNVSAMDVDSGDVLTYDISSFPASEISIDSNTGAIVWLASIVDYQVGIQRVLEVLITATDGDEIINAIFNITVLPNPRPSVSLLSPANHEIVSAFGTELNWFGTDEKNDSLTFDVYLSTDLSAITRQLDSARVVKDTNQSTYLLESLEYGSIYYWIVLPYDGWAYGLCSDGIFSFIINTPPTISSISSQKAVIGEKFSYTVESSDDSATVEDLVYYLDAAPDGMSIHRKSGLLTWIPTRAQDGEHIIIISLSDGIDIVNTSFTIKVTESSNVNALSRPTIVSITTFLLLAIIIGGFIGGTEYGKYKFLSITFAPMYNRLHSDRVLDNNIRGQIQGYIKAKPGENFNSIKNALDLKNGIFAHHLRILEKEGYVYSKRDGFYTRIYPSGVKSLATDLPKLNELQQNLVEIIRTRSGITQHEIISLLDKSQQAISYNLNNLVRNNLIFEQHEGRERKYYFNQELATPLGVSEGQTGDLARIPTTTHPPQDSAPVQPVERLPRLPAAKSESVGKTSQSMNSKLDNNKKEKECDRK
jgi:predicted transcriptional regulator